MSNKMPELILGNELETEVEKIQNAPAQNILQIEPQPEPEPVQNTPEQTYDAFALDNLPTEEQEVVKDFVKKINITDQNIVMQFGSAAQNKIAKFSDSVLENVKTKDLGHAGKSLASLVSEIKSFDATGEDKKPGFLGSIFGRDNSVKKQIEKLMAGYSKVETNIDSITSELEGHKRTLLKDIATMDSLYEHNNAYFKEITMYIIAGEERLKQFRANEISQQRKKAERSGDEMEIQRLNDLVNLADRFEKKLHDLKMTRMISIQMAPQIRMIQNNDAILSEKIQSSITNAIPLWKNQMVIALGLANSQAALEAQKKVTDMTNELLVKNSEMLKQSSINTAKAAEESIISIETVRKTNENLISTINEVMTIQRKGAEARNAAESELSKLEGNLKSALLEASRRNI